MLSYERARKSSGPPPEGLRERNKQEKVDRVLRAARRLFSKKGFEATTTREIAKQASIGTGTLFLHFADKADVLCHLFDEDVTTVLDEAFETISTDRPLVEQLLHVFGALYSYYERDPGLARVFVRELVFLEEKQRVHMFEMAMDVLVRLTQLVERAKARGEVADDIPAFHAAHQCFGNYTFTLLMWLGGSLESKDIALAHLRTSLEILMRGIAKKGES